jgi:hypothetical protein
MASKGERLLTAAVLGTLNYALHQAFYPDGIHEIDEVYVMGRDVFRNAVEDPQMKENGKMVSLGNRLHGKDLYVLNRSIDPDEKYG